MTWLEWIVGLYALAIVVAVLLGMYLRLLHVAARDHSKPPDQDA